MSTCGQCRHFHAPDSQGKTCLFTIFERNEHSSADRCVHFSKRDRCVNVSTKKEIFLCSMCGCSTLEALIGPMCPWCRRPITGALMPTQKHWRQSIEL